jgi:hypothetical protein
MIPSVVCGTVEGAGCSECANPRGAKSATRAFERLLALLALLALPYMGISNEPQTNAFGEPL